MPTDFPALRQGGRREPLIVAIAAQRRLRVWVPPRVAPKLAQLVTAGGDAIVTRSGDGLTAKVL